MTDQYRFFAPIIKDHGLTAITELRVAWALLDRLDPNSGAAQVSQAELAAAVGCDQRAVRRATKRLVERGHFRIVEKGPNAATVYAPAMERAPLPPQTEAGRTTPPPQIATGGDIADRPVGTAERPQHTPQDQEPSPISSVGEEGAPESRVTATEPTGGGPRTTGRTSAR